MHLSGVIIFPYESTHAGNPKTLKKGNLWFQTFFEFSNIAKYNHLIAKDDLLYTGTVHYTYLFSFCLYIYYWTASLGQLYLTTHPFNALLPLKANALLIKAI